MTTWKLPDPPDSEVSLLRDETGRTFHRLELDSGGSYWVSEELGAGRGAYSWPQLLEQRGPVTDDDR